jgi:hypothetical protein
LLISRCVRDCENSNIGEIGLGCGEQQVHRSSPYIGSVMTCRTVQEVQR